MKIVFFNPSRVVGGAEYLFYRVAKQMVSKGIDTSYIDYENGFICNLIKQNRDNIKIVKFCSFKKYKLDSDTTLILPLSNVFTASSFFKGDFKIFLWSIYPRGLNGIIASLNKRSFIKRDMLYYSDSIKQLIESGGLYFMDFDNFYYQNKLFNLEIGDIDYLPIPCPDKVIKKIFKQNTTLNIGWLGRLSSEKRYSVANIIDNCNLYLDKNPLDKINFHIIGDGEYMDYLKSKEVNERLNLIFLKTLLDEELYDYVVKNIDMMFAMGTSALESSSMNVPTVLMDHSLVPFDIKSNFRFLYSSIGYSLGSCYEDKIIDNNLTFESLMNILKSLNRLEEEGKKCYFYYSNNHSEESVVSKLILYLERNKLTYDKLKNTKFGKKNILERIRYIYTDAKYKKNTFNIWNSSRSNKNGSTSKGF